MKTKKYSPDYWLKKSQGWDTMKDITAAISQYKSKGEHPQIDFQGTADELAMLLFASWRKRGGATWLQGFFPTKPEIAEQLAGMVGIEPGEIVFDPGCGFGNLSRAVVKVQPKAKVLPIELQSSVFEICAILSPELEPGCYDFLSVEYAPPAFDSVIVNPPFGNTYGVPNAELEFMNRIADLSKSGTIVGAILPPTFWSKNQKEFVKCRERFSIIDDVDLGNEAFKPMTSVSTHAYKLVVE